MFNPLGSASRRQKADQSMPGHPRPGANTRIVVICAIVLIAMTGASFAAVPLYHAFCQTTGFAGAVPRARKAPGTILNRKLTVSFDTHVRGLPWTFVPLQNRQTLNLGQTGLAFFTVTNNADEPRTGRAAYNVSPDTAGAYFRKIQCFCFNDQTIAAHASVKFPVVYFVDPKFATDPDTKDFTDIALSYTFFPATPASGIGVKN
jgi:cytochrome c oxidase assembly protein subunit 11